MFNKDNVYKIGQTPKNSLKLKRFSILFLIIISIAGYYVASIPDNDNPQTTNPNLVEATSNSEKQPHPLDNLILPEGVSSAVGTLDHGIIKSSGSSNPIPMASITKIVTALVVLQKAPLSPGEQGDKITLQPKDEDYYWQYAAIEGTLTPVTAGFEMSQYEILETMLLPSSNNMSDTLVDYYFDSKESFLNEARLYLTSKGLDNTVVVDTTGFSPESVSTPEDLIKLGQLALSDPVIAEIVAKPKSSVSVAGEIPNYNILIEEPNVTGIKPGFTDEAGSCLLYSAKFTTPGGSEHNVIFVVMGAQDRPQFVNSTLSMLDQARTIYSQIP